MSQQRASCGGPLNAPPAPPPVSPVRDLILGTVDDLIAHFLYYDRKEDDQLPENAIEHAVASGEVTVDEIVLKFREALESVLDG